SADDGLVGEHRFVHLLSPFMPTLNVAENATTEAARVIFRSSSGAGEVVAIRRPTYLRTGARLSGSDYRGILEFLHTAGEVDGTDPFPEQVLARLRELVPCDTVSYGDFDRDFDREGHGGAPVSATRECRVPRLRLPSARRTPGSPTSIHIGRGAPRQ